MKAGNFAKLVLSATISFGLFGCTKSLPNPTGQVKLDASTYDLGELEEGQSKSATLVCKNLTAGDIGVDELAVSCACTGAHISDPVIHAGGQAKIYAEMKNAGRKGSFHSLITVNWHALGSSASGQVSAQIFARALSLVNVAPSRLDFGAVDHSSSPVHLDFDVTRGDSRQPWTNLQASTSAVYSSVRLQKTNDDKYTVQVSIDPARLPIGAFVGNVDLRFIDTKSQHTESRTVGFKGNVSGDIAFKPDALYFGKIELNTKKSGRIVLTDLKNRPMHVKEVKSSRDEQAFQFGECVQTSESSCVIPYDYVAGSERGDRSGRIEIVVDDGEQHTVSIPFMAFL